ncbi:YutD family protein [Brevibacillus migulae]|uniref:YutD family protein n=1 Tax=Brevibacillus migulae TaxID=1644114 RepID=UPI001F257795|nr:YutD family protein [Brevibacillus migulae]
MQASAYEIVDEYRNGWNQEAFKERYSDILDKYDFVVGDWGYGQLRLRGFYDNANRRVPFEQRIDFLDEYLHEFCNFGCPYFVLRKLKGEQLPPGMEWPGDDETPSARDQERVERPDRYIRTERPERRPARPNPRQDSSGGASRSGQYRQERGDRAAKPGRQEQNSNRSDKQKTDRPSKEKRGGNGGQYRPNREKVSSNPANGPRENRT